MTLPIALTLFVVFGALFGAATHAHRHLFSEGHTRRLPGDDSDPMQGRWAWVVLCAVLWPLMVLAGAFTWWVARSR